MSAMMQSSLSGGDNSNEMSRYQLRRIGNADSANPQLNCIALDSDVLRFGRNPEQVHVILHSTCYSNMISREHAEIRRQRNADGTTAFYLGDSSLNGTYINDFRVKEAVLLHPGDSIKFGHINGAAIPPGQHAPQRQAEFTYVFEKVPRQSSSNGGNGGVTAAAPNSRLGGGGGGGVADALEQQQQQMAANYASLNASNPYAASFRHLAAVQQPFANAHYQQNRLQAAYAAANYGAPAFHAYHTLPSAAGQSLLSHPLYNAALYGHYRGATPGMDPAMQQHLPFHSPAVWPSAVSSSPVVLPPANTPFSTSAAVLSSVAGGMATDQLLHGLHHYPSTTGHFGPSVPTTLETLEHGFAGGGVIVGGPSSSQLLQLADDKVDIRRMECDSSVPSPPKLGLAPAADFTARSTASQPSGQQMPPTAVSARPEDESGLSQDLRNLAASAAEQSRRLYNSSPDAMFDAADKSTDSVILVENSPAAVSASPPPERDAPGGGNSSAAELKRRRKSNEVARLLSDLTEGSFMQQAAARPRADASPPKQRKRLASGASSPDSLSSASASSTSHVSESNGGVDERLSSGGAAEVTHDKYSPLKKRKEFRSPLPTVSPESAVAVVDDKRESSTRTATSMASPLAKRRSVDAPSSQRKSLAAALRGSPHRRTRGQSPRPRGRAAAGRGRRGRSAAAERTSPAASTGWQWHEADAACAAGGACVKPRDEQINWVECDDCKGWYHVDCVECRVEELDDDEADFHCGCAPPSPASTPSPRPTRSRRGAGSTRARRRGAARAR